MTFDEVRTWLADNAKDAQVVRFLSELAPAGGTDADAVARYLETPDGQKTMQPHLDRITTKAIQTYRDNHYQADLKAAVAAEMLRINPAETPEQKQIRDLKDAVEKAERERHSDKLRRQMVEEASKIGIDAFFIDDYLPASIEEGKLYLSKIKAYVEGREAKKANELMTAKGFKPSPSAGGDKIDPARMTPQERTAYYIKQAEARQVGNATPKE